MKSMYATMQHLRGLKRDRALQRGLPKDARAALLDVPESLPAAMVSQMHRRDALLTEGVQPLLDAAVAMCFAETPPATHVCSGAEVDCAAVAAGYALRQQAVSRAGARPVTIAVLRSYPSLEGVTSLIHKHGLSLLVVAMGDPETRADAERRLLHTPVPILPVDATDAVAVCRVMQESMLRARNGWGGVIIHAAKIDGAEDPLTGMEQRLRNRGLLPPKDETAV